MRKNLLQKSVALACLLFSAIASNATTVEFLHTFSEEENSPPRRLIQAANGEFYGIAGEADGPTIASDVFRLYKDGNGIYQKQWLGIQYPIPEGIMQANDGAIYVTRAVESVDRIQNGIVSPFADLSTLDDRPTSSLLQASDGNFYGTTRGKIYRVTPGGVVSTLHVFNMTDGTNASGGLIEGTDGSLYGTTLGDWQNNFDGGGGTIFKITTNGVFTLLHSFNTSEPVYPNSIIQGSDGNFYGTTAWESPTIFKMTPGGSVTTLYTFDNTTVGNDPRPLFEKSPGVFHGTTQQRSGGLGSIFKITSTGTVTLLHQFEGYNAFETVEGPTQLVLANDGHLYGMLPDRAFDGPPQHHLESRSTLFRLREDLADGYPAIELQPIGQTNVLGSTIKLVTVASGQQPIGYQWQKDGSNVVNAGNISGASSPFLTITNGVAADSGDYTLVVTNSIGSVTSFVAAVDFSGSVVAITSQPTSQTVASGMPASFSVTATGSGPVTYQWMKGALALVDGTTISGAKTSTLTLANVTTNDAGSYSVVVENSFSWATSSSASLTVLGAPTIAQHPTSRTIIVGSSTTLSVTASGATGYQWQKNGTALPGQTMTSYTINNAQLVDSGEYSVVITNLVASVTSNPAQVNVLRPMAVYNGLFHETDAIRHDTAGFITIKTSGTNYSGKIILEGLPSSFSGKLANDGTVTKTIVRTNVGRENVTLNFSINPSNDQIAGTISNASWNASLLADYWPYSIVNPATAFRSTNTLAFPGFSDGSEGPTGFSSASLLINSIGKVNVVGTTADGQTLKAVVPLAQSGTFPVYSPMYPVSVLNHLGKLRKEYRGSVMGWLTMTNDAPAGTLSWIKTGWTNALYSTGFTNEQAILGSQYNYVGGIRVMDMTNGSMTFSGGNLVQPFSANVLLKSNNVLSVTLPQTNKVTVALAAKRGLFAGSFRHPENTNIVTRLRGAILQQQNYGAGAFAGTNHNGSIHLTPQ